MEPCEIIKRLRTRMAFRTLPLAPGIAGTIQGYQMLAVDICGIFNNLPLPPSSAKRLPIFSGGFAPHGIPLYLGMIISAIDCMGIGLLE